MHVLTLDFQNTRLRPGWKARILLLVGLVTGACLTYAGYLQFNERNMLQSQQAQLEQKTHHVKRVVALSPEQRLKQQNEIKSANAVISTLSLPWTELFNDIGDSQQNQVALLSIVPDAAKQSIKLTGEARNLSAILTYIRNLQKAKSLRAVYLQSHKVELRSAEKPVHFSVLAKWVETQ